MSVFIRSFGCSTNLADGEALAGCLAKAGYPLAENLDTADIVIYNTCGVKEPTENRMLEILKRVPPHKKLIVSGCLPLINFRRLCKEVRFDGVLGPGAGEGILQVVDHVLNGKQIIKLEGAVYSKPNINLPRIKVNQLISILPISYGCLGSCTYCCVILARGRLRSYRIQEIVEKVKTDIASGVQEFWITSQDTACYGRDLNENLADLLRTISNIEGDFRIRVGMMTPNQANNILEDLVQVFQSEKIFKFIHLPVQSGDDEVLQLMRRSYSTDDFKSIVNAFRKNFPDISLATDIICGFPGETKEAFERTLQLIEKVQPDVVNVSKFFARPGTLAAKMREKFVSPDQIKHRSRLTAKLTKKVALEKNKRWIGWTGKIHVDETGKMPDSYIGRNFAYKPVVLKNWGSKRVIGATVDVKVVNAFTTYLEGKILE